MFKAPFILPKPRTCSSQIDRLCRSIDLATINGTVVEMGTKRQGKHSRESSSDCYGPAADWYYSTAPSEPASTAQATAAPAARRSHRPTDCSEIRILSGRILAVLSLLLAIRTSLKRALGHPKRILSFFLHILF